MSSKDKTQVYVVMEPLSEMTIGYGQLRRLLRQYWFHLELLLVSENGTYFDCINSYAFSGTPLLYANFSVDLVHLMYHSAITVDAEVYEFCEDGLYMHSKGSAAAV